MHVRDLSTAGGVPLEAACLAELGRTPVSGRIPEDRAAAGLAHGLRRAPAREELLHLGSDLSAVAGVEGERRLEDDVRAAKARPTIAPLDVGAPDAHEAPSGTEDHKALDATANPLATRARIHGDGASKRTRDAAGEFQARHRRLRRRSHHARKRDGGTRDDLVILRQDLDARELAAEDDDAAVKAGAPEGIIGWIEEPTVALSQRLMSHPDVNVILATGGASYPATGSTGDGYSIAAALGHTIIPPEGSLVPLETAGNDCQEMQGLSLRNVGVKLLNAKGKVLYKDFGELLFTHFGVSGPTVLSASCHLKGDGCRLVLDLKPALEGEKLEARILRDLEQYQNRSMENALVDLLPRSMIPVVLRRLDISPEMQANSLTKQKRRALVELLKAFPIDITGKRPVSEAIITSGGVKVSEIDPKTMESKLVAGLHFAGEVIDCDAYTGGFNLQIAWATAYAAGMAVG